MKNFKLLLLLLLILFSGYLPVVSVMGATQNPAALEQAYNSYLNAVKTNDQNLIRQTHAEYLKLLLSEQSENINLDSHPELLQILPPPPPDSSTAAESAASQLDPPDWSGTNPASTSAVADNFHLAKRNLDSGNLKLAREEFLELYQRNEIPGARETAAYFLGVINALEGNETQARNFFIEAETVFMNQSLDTAGLQSMIAGDPELIELATIFVAADQVEKELESFDRSNRNFFSFLGSLSPMYISARSRLSSALEKFITIRDRAADNIEKIYYSSYENGQVTKPDLRKRYRQVLTVAVNTALNTTARSVAALNRQHDQTPRYHFIDRIVLRKRSEALTSDYIIYAEDLERLEFDFKSLSEVFEYLPTAGNDQGMVKLIECNMDALYTRWLAIESAKSTIDITYFIIKPDLYGKALLSLLNQKARQGVKIRLMVDARGTPDLINPKKSGRYLTHLLNNPDVEIRVYNPTMNAIRNIFSDVRNVVMSNHDKIIIIDNKLAVTGGRNIGADYLSDPADYPEAFKDTDVIIHSPAASLQLKQAFEEEFYSSRILELKSSGFNYLVDIELELIKFGLHFYLMTGQLLDQKLTPGQQELISKINSQIKKFPRHRGGLQKYDSNSDNHLSRIRIIDKNTLVGTRTDIMTNLIKLLDVSSERVLIQNQYIVLTRRAERAIKRASLRGVAVDISTMNPVAASSIDVLTTQAFLMKDWQRLLTTYPTLRLFALKRDQKLHSKVFTFDSEIAVVSTYNMDPMSEDINSEVAAVIMSTPFTGENIEMINTDISESVEYRIRRQSDGSSIPLSGPEDFCSSLVLTKYKIIMKLNFLRPLI